MMKITIARQQGYVLIFTLVIMLIISYTVLTNNRSTIVAEKLTEVAIDRNSALEVAERAIREGIEEVAGLAGLTPPIETQSDLATYLGALNDHSDYWYPEGDIPGTPTTKAVTINGLNANYYIQHLGSGYSVNEGSSDIEMGSYHNNQAPTYNYELFQVIANTQGRSGNSGKRLTVLLKSQFL